MANKKISELPTADTPDGSEVMEVVQGGINKKLALNELPGGASSASDVSFTPAGNIAATDVQAAIEELDSEKAPLASPALTGTPTAPTAANGTNTTQIATTAFVQSSLSNVGSLLYLYNNFI